MKWRPVNLHNSQFINDSFQRIVEGDLPTFNIGNYCLMSAPDVQAIRVHQADHYRVFTHQLEVIQISPFDIMKLQIGKI